MISSRPLVSVVIPTRNRPILVLRAVRSALHQTLREIEVIVVIDGEPGRETADAIARLYEDRVRCIVLQEAVGGSEARNIGIRDAHVLRGLLCSIDDDEWLPAKLELQLEAALRQAGNSNSWSHASTYFAPKAKSM